MRRFRFVAAEDLGREKEEGISHSVSGSAPVGLPSCEEQPRLQQQGKEVVLPQPMSPLPSHSLGPALPPTAQPRGMCWGHSKAHLPHGPQQELWGHL